MPNSGAAVAEQDLEQMTSLFRLLSDKTRLNILLSLVDGERNVTSLCEQLQLPQPTVSHHLGLLRVNNIIANRRRGKQVFYAFNGGMAQADGSALELAIENYLVRITRKGFLATST